jgi:hypothetical protein
MPQINSPSSSSAERVVTLRHGIAGGDGASTSGTKPAHESAQLASPEGLRVRRPTVEMSPIRTPDSQTRLLSNRSSPNSPLSHHVMASRLHHLVKASMGGVEELSPDVEARLVENVGVLMAKGLDTPEKVQKLLKQAWRHDAAIAVAGLGLTGNAGYAIGMELASEKLVAMLPPHILRNPSMLGMLIGLGVGGLDVMISVMGKATMKPLIYNGAEGNGHLPASIKVPAGVEAIMESMKLATSANVVKNTPRMGAPGVQAFFENRLDGVTNSSIDRLTADRVDTALDAGLGFAASSYVQFKNLTGGPGFDARMLLRDDLGAVIDKMERSYKDSAIDVAKSVGTALTSPAVPLAVTATIGYFISHLFAANASIDGSLHAKGTSHGHLDDSRADWSVMTAKRASSVVSMAIMTATIEIGAPIVGAAAQAATEATVSAAGKAKEKITGAATSAAASAMNFVNASAGQLPNIGGWVAQRLGLQPQAAAEAAEGDIEMGHPNPSLRHNVRIEDLT